MQTSMCFAWFNCWCFYGWFRSGMQTKQEPVDSLNVFNEMVLITVMFVSDLHPNTTFYLSKQWGSMRGVLICRRKRQVYRYYTRQDCPMKKKQPEDNLAVFNYIFFSMKWSSSLCWSLLNEKCLLKVQTCPLCKLAFLKL